MTTPSPELSSRTPRQYDSYQDLHVWKQAVELAIECYQCTASFPFIERYGLTAQIRRAAVSVVSNIAEGHGRRSHRAFAHHLSIARGSVKELESQIVVAERLGYVPAERIARTLELCTAVSRMLSGLQRAIESPRAD